MIPVVDVDASSFVMPHKATVSRALIPPTSFYCSRFSFIIAWGGYAMSNKYRSQDARVYGVVEVRYVLVSVALVAEVLVRFS